MITAQHTLLRVQVGIFISYVLVKFMLRPIVLEHGFGGLLQILVLSYPNFCEAIIGSIFLAFALLVMNGKVVNRRLKEKNVPAISVLITGIYVILQELNVHNLGGKNVCDPYDILFSILGLITAFYVLIRLQPKAIPKQNKSYT